MAASARLDLQPVPTSVAAARRFVRRLLIEWELTHLVETVALLTSEVSTNAVLHARTPYAVVVCRADHEIIIDVLDGSGLPPARREASTTAATGRGVALVAGLSRRWGATPRQELQGFVKGVRFEVAVDDIDELAWADNP